MEICIAIHLLMVMIMVNTQCNLTNPILVYLERSGWGRPSIAARAVCQTFFLIFCTGNQ